MRHAVFAALLLLPMQARAEPATVGMDGRGCEAWLASRRETPERASMLQWAMGFVSGAAAGANVDALGSVTFGDVDRLLTTYCLAYKDATLGHAASVVATTLIMRWKARQ